MPGQRNSVSLFSASHQNSHSEINFKIGNIIFAIIHLLIYIILTPGHCILIRKRFVINIATEAFVDFIYITSGSDTDSSLLNHSKLLLCYVRSY